MPQHSHGMHHFHQRRRAFTEKVKEYFVRDKIKSFFDKAIYVIALLGPSMTVPQSYIIWAHKSAENVSTITWSTYIFNSLFWLAYGILHKERPIILSNILWLLVNGSIILGIILYS